MEKNVLVTGASSGIGYNTAIELKNKGYKVYAAARRMDRLNELEKVGIIPIYLDITDNDSIQLVVSEIINRDKRLDVLVNNAGYGLYGALEDVPEKEARMQFDVNIFGLMNLTKEFLPYMRKNKSGRIVNISSIGGKAVQPFGGWYHASKFAVEALSDALRMELKTFNVEVIIIEPGGIDTEWSQIAYNNLYEFSKNGPYNGLLKKGTKPPSGVSPKVVAKCISKALSDKNPKTRYQIGKMAKTTIWARLLLSDKLMDKIAIKMNTNSHKV